MYAQEVYTERQIKVAFSRYFRGGGELLFKDSWTGVGGSILVDWDSFLEELRKTVKQNEVSSESF